MTAVERYASVKNGILQCKRFVLGPGQIKSKPLHINFVKFDPLPPEVSCFVFMLDYQTGSEPKMISCAIARQVFVKNTKFADQGKGSLEPTTGGPDVGCVNINMDKMG